VKSIDDFRSLKDIGTSGDLNATAFYEGKISLKELEVYLSISTV